MRILVTGSRQWSQSRFLWEKLDHCLDTALIAGGSLTLVHGACRSGADAMADSWGRRYGVNPANRLNIERHPADWTGPCRKECQVHHRRLCNCKQCRGEISTAAPTHPKGTTLCPAAGFYRNEDMVRLGADFVLAFIADESKGATHCARYAETSGLTVFYYRTGAKALF